MIRRTMLLVGLAFAAALAIPSAGAAATAPSCLESGVGTVCVDRAPLCPHAWYVPPFTDSGAAAGACTSGWADMYSITVCESVVAGYWNYAGFIGVNDQLCVWQATYPGSPACAAVYTRNVDTRPLCLP